MLYVNRTKRSIILYSPMGTKKVVHPGMKVDGTKYIEVKTSPDFAPIQDIQVQRKQQDEPSDFEKELQGLKTENIILQNKIVQVENRISELKIKFENLEKLVEVLQTPTKTTKTTRAPKKKLKKE